MVAEILQYSDKRANNVCLFSARDMAFSQKMRISPTRKTFGLEIELLGDDDFSEMKFAKLLFDAIPELREGKFFLKRDSSLDAIVWQDYDDGEISPLPGLELVTGVMSRNFAFSFPWERFFRSLQNVIAIDPFLQFTPETPDFGLHIHVGSCWNEQHVSPLVPAYLLETASNEEILRVFGRTTSYAKKAEEIRVPDTTRFLAKRLMKRFWAESRTRRALGRPYPMIQEHNQKPLSKFTEAELRSKEILRMYKLYSDRHCLVNPKNEKTIEFRGFLTPHSGRQVRWALGLVEAIMDFSRNWQDGRSSSRIPMPTWNAFMEEYPLLSRGSYLES